MSLKIGRGRGFATEAARAIVRDAFARLNLDELVSFTAIKNERSWRVMERIGMKSVPEEDFEHPKVPVGHALRGHRLFRLRRADSP